MSTGRLRTCQLSSRSNHVLAWRTVLSTVGSSATQPSVVGVGVTYGARGWGEMHV